MPIPLPPEDWPHRAASRLVPVAPHHWHVQEFGHGPDMIFLHGAGASAHSWHRLVPHLANRVHMIAPDLPGHGFTRSPRGRARLPQVAQDLARLLDALSAEPQLLVGHSAGAAIALEMVRQKLVTPRGIVVINGALEDFQGPAGWLFPMMARMMALNPFTGLMLSGSSPRQVEGLIGATGTDLDPEALALYQRLIARRSHVDGTLAMMAQWSLEALNRALPEITVPTLFLHGALDQAVAPAVAERAARAIPHAHLKLLPRVGHIAQEEVPDQVATDLLEFAATVGL